MPGLSLFDEKNRQPASLVRWTGMVLAIELKLDVRLIDFNDDAFDFVERFRRALQDEHIADDAPTDHVVPLFRESGIERLSETARNLAARQFDFPLLADSQLHVLSIRGQLLAPQLAAIGQFDLQLARNRFVFLRVELGAQQLIERNGAGLIGDLDRQSVVGNLRDGGRVGRQSRFQYFGGRLTRVGCAGRYLASHNDQPKERKHKPIPGELGLGESSAYDNANGCGGRKEKSFAAAKCQSELDERPTCRETVLIDRRGG